MTTSTVTLEQYRALAEDARAALQMIREAQYAPPGSVPSEEMVEPSFVKDAKVLVKGIGDCRRAGIRSAAARYHTDQLNPAPS